MRILFVRSNPVSPDSRVEKEVNTLINAGFDVDILAWDRDSNHKIKTARINKGSNNRIFRVGIKSEFGAGFKKNIVPLALFQKAIVQFVQRFHDRYDVIHACDFDTCFTSYCCAKRYGLKIIYDVFDYYIDAFSVPGPAKLIIRSIDKYLMNNANALILCTEERKKQVGRIRQKEVVIIHNTPDRIRCESHLKNRKTTVVYVGILNDGRLIPEMLDVIATLSDFELDIAGFGKYEELVSEYSKKYDNIIFYGKIPYSKTLELESKSDLMTAIYDPLIPNHRYAAPNKFYEALMLGKPIIMCRETGLSGNVEKYRIGTLIDYSKESLRDGLIYMRDHLQEYRDRATVEEKLYNSSFCWEIMANRLVNLYSRI